MTKLKVAYRPGREDDLGYILDTWGSTIRRYEPWCHVHPPLFWSSWKPLAKELLARSSVVVAHAAEADDHILGWVVAQPGVLHFVYVSGAVGRLYRREGIGTALVHSLLEPGFEFSHWVPCMGPLSRKWMCKYNPWAAPGGPGGSHKG